MKICLIAESYPPALGGVEFALQRLVEGLVSRGHEVQVVTSSWQRHAPSTEKHGAVSIIRIYTLAFFKRFWFLVFSIPSAIRAARWADIVQGSTFAGGPPAFLAAWLLGKKKVLIVHEVLGSRWFRFEPNLIRSLFYFLTERIIVRLPFDRYIAVSEYTRESLRSLGVAMEKISVIYHGDSRLPDPVLSTKEVRDQLGFLHPKDFIFLTFGRAGVTKGMEYLVDAIPEISKQIPAARFVLILSGYDTRILHRIWKKVSGFPTPVFRLLPPQPREMLASYVQAADCVIIPSLSEGFGFSAREACNANKVVVATNAGSLPEVLTGKHVVIEPGSPAAIVEGCNKAFRREVMVTEAKVFDWEHTISQYCLLYDGLLKSSTQVVKKDAG